jgi:zinc/manganese transport system permease protein
MAYDLLIQPFAEFAFMRRALVAVLALAMGCGPVGVILVLRRMSLIGDAMSHAVLPGAAVGFVIAGLSLFWMSLGGFVAGLLVASLSGLVARVTALREDASFAAFYLIALATGVALVSTHGSNVDLMRVLFGTVLAVDDAALLLVAGISTASLVALAAIYRPLVIECFDPGFLSAAGAGGGTYHLVFMVLVVLNLVAGFQAMGTLMAVGMMMLPATAARFWAREVWPMCVAAAGIGFASGAIGLLVSYHLDLPSGPAIVLTAGAFYAVSLAVGRHDSLMTRYLPRAHLEA